jgi:hypothetical protein
LKIIIKNNEFSFKGNNIPLPKQYSILQHANKCLEDDLEVAISKIKHFDNGQHLWAMTWTPIRLDDLQGVGLYYFIKEVIDCIVNQMGYSVSLTKLLLKNKLVKTKIINTLRINPLNFYDNHKDIIKELFKSKKGRFFKHFSD